MMTSMLNSFSFRTTIPWRKISFWNWINSEKTPCSESTKFLSKPNFQFTLIIPTSRKISKTYKKWTKTLLQLTNTKTKYSFSPLSHFYKLLITICVITVSLLDHQSFSKNATLKFALRKTMNTKYLRKSLWLKALFKTNAISTFVLTVSLKVTIMTTPN